MRNRRFFPLIVYAVLMALAFSWASGMFGDGRDDIPYSEIVRLIRSEKVKSFEVQDDVIYMELHEPYLSKTSVSATLADAASSGRSCLKTC